MNLSRDWNDFWIIGEKIGSGAQGRTCKVTSKSNLELHCVIKLLHKKKKNDPKARARMHEEITNLERVHAAGGSVPQVVDAAREFLENDAIEPYIVMEYIPGETLDAFVSSGRVTMDLAIALVLKLAETIKAGHSRRVFHRDLKPDNLIVRDLEKADIVVVDYGLSYVESDEDCKLTDSDEGVGNNFSDLPERRTGHHYPQSDTCAVCQILYYCLTGRQPKPLEDELRRKPHRRDGGQIPRFENPLVRQNLEAILDRGLEHHVFDRFQTIDELIKRLQTVSEPPQRPEIANLSEHLGKKSALLRRVSRKTVMADIKRRVEEVMNRCRMKLLHTGNPDFTPILLPASHLGINLDNDLKLTEILNACGYESIGTDWFLYLSDNSSAMFQMYGLNDNPTRTAVFRFGFEANECFMLRTTIDAKYDAESSGAFGGIVARPEKRHYWQLDNWVTETSFVHDQLANVTEERFQPAINGAVAHLVDHFIEERTDSM